MPSLDLHSNNPIFFYASEDGNDKHVKQELREVCDEELAIQTSHEKNDIKEIKLTSPDTLSTPPGAPITQENMEGVQISELLRFSWPKKYMVIAYASLILTTFTITLATMASYTYIPYVTSSFNTHSLLTTANVVDRIARIVAYPVIARLSDVFGRAKGFSIATFFILIYYVMTAGSKNIQTYVAAEIFGAIGDVGYLIMQQVFIADTTSLRNRGFWASVPETVSTIPSLYIGTIVAESVLKNGIDWRWGYGMWAIIFPVAVAPLIIVMFYL
jgi:MFS family permease